MSEPTFDRATLDGKDRDQLQAIASAIGVKGVSRLKKADLVAAIVGSAPAAPSAPASRSTVSVRAANAPDISNPASASASVPPSPTAAMAADSRRADGPKRIRSVRASEADPLVSMVAEQASLSAEPGSGDEPAAIVRPRRSSESLGAKPSSAATRTSSQPAGSASTPAPVSATAPAHGVANSTSTDPSAMPSPVAGDSAGTVGISAASGSSDRAQTAHNAPSIRASRPASSTGPSASNADVAVVPTPADLVDPQRGTANGNGGAGSENRNGDEWADGDPRKGRRNRRRGRNRDGRDGLPESESVPVQGDLIEVAGLLDLRDDGYGFLRSGGFHPGRHDAYVSASQVRKFSLRKGDHIRGAVRPATSTERYPALVRVDAINDLGPEEARGRARFEDLTPLFPDSQLKLEMKDNPGELTGRIIDLVAPIGKGQRAMVVSPPKAGKTTVIKHIVHAIERNNPECHVMVLLVDERPEEVTDMKRHVQRAEVVASTFDRPSEEHCQVAELTIERAKRLVELGNDVVIVLDGITRLARAYNLASPGTGRIMSGGIDAGALYPPKKFFGAARNVEEGGSLTIIATALVETNSKMDEHIFEEFKGTGNSELRLDRRLADRRIFPSIDIEASGTRREELLFDRIQIQQVWKLRKVVAALDAERGGDGGKGLELLLDKLRSTTTNLEFLSDISKASSL